VNDDGTLWMKCPYPDEICAQPLTWHTVVFFPYTDEVEGEGICAAGHRWRITKLPNDPTPS
jgi:hypothetical protein